MSVETCQLCQQGSPLYRWDQVCCRARFLVNLPRQADRTACIERWKAKDGEVFVGMVRQAGLNLWNAERNG